MDTESLSRSLNARDVRYVVIGATAFPVHGYARATLDVDIFIAPDPDNAQRTLDALRDAGNDVSDLTLDDLLTKKVLIRQYILETDIHPFVAGVTFEQVWADRVASQIGEAKRVRLLAPPAEGQLISGEAGLDIGDRVRIELVATDVERGYIDFARR